jgi:hypothetical protein
MWQNVSAAACFGLHTYLAGTDSHFSVPVSLLYNLANGFHNVPSQFRDTTVRLRDPFTNLSSSMRAGAKELGFGLYDAVTGLVIQPIIGYKSARIKHGNTSLGILNGVGLGVIGLLSKTPAAIIGPLGYSGKGLERTFQRWRAGAAALRGHEYDALMQAKEELPASNEHGHTGKHSAHLM